MEAAKRGFIPNGDADEIQEADADALPRAKVIYGPNARTNIAGQRSVWARLQLETTQLMPKYPGRLMWEQINLV